MNSRGSGRRRSRNNRSNNRGPNDGNRLDNRQRGNANQLCEKYKSMARDAHQQGDRVMNEYYLQFADHYFRVLTESQQQKKERDEARQAKKGDDDGDAKGKPKGGKGNDKPKQRQADNADNADTGGQEPPKKTRGRPKAADKSQDGNGRDDHANGAEKIDVDRLPAAISVDAESGDQANGAGPKEKKPSSRAKPKPDLGDEGASAEA